MKRIILTDTHTRRDGTLFLQWQKQISDDGVKWENLNYHRTSVPPAGDIDKVISDVDAHVREMGFSNGVDPADVARAKAHLELATSDRLPLSDDAAQARIDLERERQTEIEACRNAVEQANINIAILTDQGRAKDDSILTLQGKLQVETAAHEATKAIVRDMTEQRAELRSVSID